MSHSPISIAQHTENVHHDHEEITGIFPSLRAGEDILAALLAKRAAPILDPNVPAAMRGDALCDLARAAGRGDREARELLDYVVARLPSGPCGPACDGVGTADCLCWLPV